MAENSKIEWTDHTFNPWFGCQKVSPACTNCYAEVATPTRVSRSIGLELWGPESAGAVRRVNSETEWNKVKRWNKQAGEEGKRLKVFCSSMADIFEDYQGKMVNHNGEQLCLVHGGWRPTGKEYLMNVPITLEHVRIRLFQLITDTPNLDWLLLTKRPENVRGMVPWGNEWPDNVWMGTTVENQKYADIRIPELMRIPAKVRFLSCEPLLGPIEFSDVSRRSDAVQMLGKKALDGIHWIIVGGESGHDARAMPPRWALSIRDQCAAAGVAFFFKQWGEWNSVSVMVGKKAARYLEGELYSQFPK